MGESNEHALVKEGVKQALEAIGWKVEVEKRVDDLTVDILAVHPESGVEVIFEVIVKKNLEPVKKERLEEMGYFVYPICAGKVVGGRKLKQLNDFTQVIRLYRDSIPISEICKRIGLNRSLVENWARGNGTPNLVDRKTALRLKEMIVNRTNMNPQTLDFPKSNR